LDESPGPLLTIHGSSSELRSVAVWIESHVALSACPQQNTKAIVRFDERNELLWKDPEAQSPVRFKQILRGLLLGATWSKKPGQTSVAIDRDAYESVTRVLTSPRIQSADEPFNPLALFMMQRANVYLTMKRKELEKAASSKTDVSIVAYSNGLITRREVVDLGNINGKTTLELVQFLMKNENGGLSKFRSCGLSVPLKSDEWPSIDAERCRRLLLRWSPKQVRTHFHRLVGEGLISAIRTADNQPWHYCLPESFTKSASPFGKLPTPNVLSFPLGEINPSAPE
jgi:hypothetical protein